MPSRRNARETPEVASGLLALAEAAHALRLARGWTLDETAERADLDVRHVQQIESGTGG